MKITFWWRICKLKAPLAQTHFWAAQQQESVCGQVKSLHASSPGLCGKQGAACGKQGAVHASVASRGPPCTSMPLTCM